MIQRKWRSMAKKVYAVRKGRKTGIFDTWDECQKQVSGFSGAEYKSFVSREGAMEFLGGSAETDNVLPWESTAGDDTLGGESGIFPDSFDRDTAVAYVDGSFDKVSGDFSYGMVILYRGEEMAFCERIQDKELAQMHNVAGEIKGAEAAMRYAVENGIERIVIYHDYEGIAKWCNGAWRANKEGTKAYRAYYDQVKDKLKIQFIKVKGHSGDKYNDMADRLAKKALNLA